MVSITKTLLCIRTQKIDPLAQFKTLSPEDQVVLLRTNMTEMCHLRGAIRSGINRLLGLMNNYVLMTGMTSSRRTLCGISPKKISFRWHFKSQTKPQGKNLLFSSIMSPFSIMMIIFSPGKSSSRQSGSGSGFSFQNALIGQQDMSKFYRTSTTQKIFGMVSKLCEIGELCNATKIFSLCLLHSNILTCSNTEL